MCPLNESSIVLLIIIVVIIIIVIIIILLSYSNSGIRGGQFLERTRVSKPSSTPEEPVYYTPKDFQIGDTIEAFKHQFVITGTDQLVLKYMKERPDEFPDEVVASFESSSVEKELQP